MDRDSFEHLRCVNFEELYKEIGKIFSVKYDWNKDEIKDGSVIILGAFILLMMQEDDSVKTLEDVLSNISVSDDIWKPINNIGISYSDEDGDDNFKHLLELKGKYTADELKACILFGKNTVGVGIPLTRTPFSLCELAIRILEIEADENVADLCAGEGTFFRNAFIEQPEANFYVSEIDEDLAEATFTRAYTIGMKINNDFPSDMFCDFDNMKFDKVFCELGKTNRVENDLFSKQNENIENDWMNFNGTKEWWYCRKIISYLNEGGKAVVILSSTALTSPKDENIRKWFVKNGYIEKVILLPEKMYEGINYTTSMIVLSFHNDEISFLNAYDEYKIDRIGGKKYFVLDENNIDTICQKCQMKSDIGIKVSCEDVISNYSILNPLNYLLSYKEIENGICLKSVVKSIRRGMQIKGKEFDLSVSSNKTDYKYITLGDVQDGVINSNLLYYQDIDDSKMKYVAKKNSLLVSKNGKPFKVAVTNEDNMLVSGNFYIVEVDETKIDPLFIMAFFDSDKGKQEIMKKCSTGILPILTLTAIQEILIPDCSRNIQEKVVKEYLQTNNLIKRKQQEIEELNLKKCELFNRI